MFTTEIKPKSKWYEIDLKALWYYRDLLMLFVRRDFVSVYKQTVLGPIWFFVQPILTTITFTIIFGNVAKLPTDGIPPVIFYLSGITFWNYFAGCLTSTSNTFVSNAGVFGKVYFPRLITPLSTVVSNLIKFAIQFLLFLGFFFYYWSDGSIQPNATVFFLPLFILMMAGLGLGYGILISSLTTKYRDFTFLVGFGVQLLMYASPIIYPFSLLDAKYRMILNIVNPMSSIIEAIKYGFLGEGVFSPLYLGISFLYMIVLLFVGVVLFHKVEKNFMDTV
ncbi:MAG: ABC transporter permease [Bacteroidetes bacterium]|nr:ABC transporter permease [Bacteroidota bacterium]